MCDSNNTHAIEQIASDVKIIKADVSRMEKHLEKQNGRIASLESAVASNTLNIAVQENRCILRTEFEGKNLAHLQEDIKSNSEKVLEFAKKNGVQVAEIVAIVGMFGKISGWW